MSAIDRTTAWASTATDVAVGTANGRPLQRFADAIRETYEPGTDDPWWYDNSAHFLSGSIIGLLTWSVLGLGTGQTIAVYFGLATVWEWFEYSYGVRPWDEREDWSYDRAVEDTMLDTIMGLVGVLLVVTFL